jgi:hypothetical protein
VLYLRIRVGVLRMVQLLLLVSFAAGCPRVPLEYRPFFALPRRHQPAELLRQPLDRQFDIYIAGMTGAHPARIDLGLVIGEQGPRIMPTLLRRMRQARHDYEKVDLAWVLRGMPCRPSSADSVRDAIDSVQAEVSAIRDSASRADGEQMLRYAKDRCRPSANGQTERAPE